MDVPSSAPESLIRDPIMKSMIFCRSEDLKSDTTLSTSSSHDTKPSSVGANCDIISSRKGAYSPESSGEGVENCCEKMLIFVHLPELRDDLTIFSFQLQFQSLSNILQPLDRASYFYHNFSCIQSIEPLRFQTC